MQKITFVLLALFICTSSFAQKKKEKWHPFSNVPDLLFYLELNGFGQEIAKENAYGMGFKGAVTWNAKNAIGFTYGNTINKFAPAFETDSAVYLKNALTGLYYERTIMPSKRVHLTVPLAVGVGNAYYDWRELDAKGAAGFPYTDQYYLYIEPAVKVGVKLTDKFRLNAGATYSIAPLEFDYRGVTNEHLSTMRFQAGIRYGIWWAAK